MKNIKSLLFHSILFLHFFQYPLFPFATNQKEKDYISILTQAIEVNKESNNTDKKSEDRPRYNIAGHRNMKYKTYWVKGDRMEFLSLNGLINYNTKLVQNSAIQFKAEFEKNISMIGKFMELPYQDRVLTLEIKGKYGNSTIGDFSTQFGNSDFTLLSKSIRGFSYEYNFPSLKIKTLISKEKSYRNVETFTGKNINGPYRLNATSIVEGSEIIKIDGKVIEPKEYILDYFLGEITFTFKVDTTETVEISYEAETFSPIIMGGLKAIMTEYYIDKNLTLYSSFTTSKEERTKKLITISKKDIFFVKNEDIGKTNFNLQSKIVKFLETVKNNDTGKNLIKNEDYQINYAEGIITFLKEATALGEVEINYSYYNPNFIKKVENEKLEGTGKLEYTLAQSTIYSGTEFVKLYEGNTFKKELKPQEDYEINEDKNLIIFKAHCAPSQSINQYVIISYEFIAKSNPEKTETEKKLYNLSFDFKKNSNFQIKGEYAQSEGDISKKFVQVMEKVILLKNPNNDNKEYLLCHCEPIRNSIEIFFNDTSNIITKKWEGSDYTIDFDPISFTTIIKFKDTPPEGTIVYSNFKYKPKINGNNIKSGSGIKLYNKYNAKNLNFECEYMKKDLTFSPFNDYNDFRTNTIDTKAQIKVGKNLFLTTNLTKKNYSLGFENEGTENLSSIIYGLKYSIKKLKEISFNLEHFEKKTSILNSNIINTQRNDANVYINYELFGAGNGISLYYQNRNYENYSLNNSEKDIEKGKLEINYKLGDNLKLKSFIETSKINSKDFSNGRENTFQTNSYSKYINLSWNKKNEIVLSGTLNFTDKEDSRDEVPDENIDNGDFSISGQNIGRLDSFYIRLYTQTTPDTIGYNSKTKILNSQFNYRITKTFIISPQYSITKAISSQSNLNETITKGISIGNQKAQKKLESTISYSINENKTKATTTNLRKDIKVGYILNYHYSKSMFIYVKQDFVKYKKEDETDNLLKCELNYSLKDSSKLSLNFIKDKQTKKSNSTIMNKYIFSWITNLSKIFSLDLNYEFQDYTNQQTQKDYKASILNTELKANF